MGDSGKLRFYELDHESEMRLLKTHSHTSNRLAMEPGTREEKQTLQQGNSHPSKTCRMPPVWRGGQERLYGKPTTEKVLWQGEPSSIWRGIQALTQGKSHAKNNSRGPSARRGVRRGNDDYPGWKVSTPTAPLGEEVFRRKKQSRTNTTHKT